MTKTHQTRLKRLEQEPKGFALEKDGEYYNCTICHAAISGETGWWDINGEKCLSCQNAVEAGVVPTIVCKDRSSWYATYEVVNKFKISPSTITTLVRDGKLKSRKIKALSGTTSFEIFLKVENEMLSA